MSNDSWISGIVIHGKGLGKKLGFPTANVALDTASPWPADGIYACRVKIGEETFKGALHVGPRPAFGDPVPTIEVHIMDFDGRDLYGQEISLQAVKRLRDVKSFESMEKLRDAIAEDCAKVREVLSM